MHPASSETGNQRLRNMGPASPEPTDTLGPAGRDDLAESESSSEIVIGREILCPDGLSLRRAFGLNPLGEASSKDGLILPAACSSPDLEIGRFCRVAGPTTYGETSLRWTVSKGLGTVIGASE